MADIQDLSTDDLGEVFLVRPDGPRAGPGIVFLHWFDEAPNANRGQYLAEAEQLADQGVVSILPQLEFPWHSPPTDTDADLTRINAELTRLRRVYDRLLAEQDVDASRIAVVGHDFGAMYGALLLSDVPARCGVLVAPTPRWSDWFLRFWRIESDRYDYMRALEAVDPITAIGGAGCTLLFQFGKLDFYIAPMTGTELSEAAAEPKELLTYDAGHAMDDPVIVADRRRFLADNLGFCS